MAAPERCFRRSLSACPSCVCRERQTQFLNAAAIARAGAGLALVPAEAGGQAIAAAAIRLLDEPSFRECAMRQGQEIALMPGPEDVVAVLEWLT